jgi:hypothetical protein
MNPIIYIIGAAALFMHFARKPHKQSTVNTPMGNMVNTASNQNTLVDYTNGYENLYAVGGGATMRPLQLSADPVLEAMGGTTKPMLLSAEPVLEAYTMTTRPMLISPQP